MALSKPKICLKNKNIKSIKIEKQHSIRGQKNRPSHCEQREKINQILDDAVSEEHREKLKNKTQIPELGGKIKTS